MATVQGKRMVPIYIDESIHREIRVYAAQIDQTIQQTIKPLSDEFEQSAIRLVSQIREMNRQAEEKRQKELEEQSIALQHPIHVEGNPVEPITNIVLEPPISS